MRPLDEEAGLPRPPGYTAVSRSEEDETDGCVTPPPPPAYQVAAQLPSYEEAERTKGERIAIE